MCESRFSTQGAVRGALESSEIRPLLPRGPYGPRLSDRFNLTIGSLALPVGDLQLHDWGGKTYSEFRFDTRWLNHRRYFAVSPELRATRSARWRPASITGGSAPFAALSDAAPSGFALTVVQRARAQGLLDAFADTHTDSGDLHTLGVVPDTITLGALRVCPVGEAQTDGIAEMQLLPRRCDLTAIAAAVAAFELGREDRRQLLLLLYSATALSGSRPKCTWIKENGELAVAKFSSVHDGRSLYRMEMLVMRLARAAGVSVVPLHLLQPARESILLATRFDRVPQRGRRPFLSARSLLLAQENDAVDLSDLLAMMQTECMDFVTDARQLWRRSTYQHLVRAKADYTRKTGFLYAGNRRWQLAPACGLRPYFDCTGPEHEADHEAALISLMANCRAFKLTPQDAQACLRQQLSVLAGWKEQATRFEVNMSQHDIDSFSQVMSNPLLERVRQLVR